MTRTLRGSGSLVVAQGDSAGLVDAVVPVVVVVSVVGGGGSSACTAPGATAELPADP